MRQKNKKCHGIIKTTSFCILQYWKQEFVLQCFNPISHCCCNKCFNREHSKAGWLVASKPKSSLVLITKQVPSWYMAGIISNQSQKQLGLSRVSCWDQVCRVTQSTAAYPNQPSPQHTTMQHQLHNCFLPLRYTQTLSSSCLSESNAVQLVAM